MSYCLIVIIVIYSCCAFNISYSPTSLKDFFPSHLSYRKYIVTLPHGGLRHEEQAILMRTILQWQHSQLPHPYRRIKPSRNCKCACTPQRCATMICFWIKNYCCPKTILSFTCLFHEKTATFVAKTNTPLSTNSQPRSTMAKKYLDPKTDLTFKKVFGEHPDLVTSLLNALLPLRSALGYEQVALSGRTRTPRDR